MIFLDRLLAIKDRIALAVIVLLLAATGWLWIGKAGLERDLATHKQKVAEATLEGEKLARAVEQGNQIQITRIIRNEEDKRKVLTDRLARTDAVTHSLRDEISRLNARPVPEGAAAAAYAGEAGAARELLGACSQRYTDLAREAEELRDQVIGLQQFAINVCRAGQ